MMDYADRARLLDPKPMPLEMGWERLGNGVLHIAIRTDMHGCTGEMFEYWFASRPDTREYRWWHPLDHVASTWIEGTPGVIPRSIHQVEERFTDLPAQTLSIQFCEPTEFFDKEAIAAARAAGDVSALLCVRGGNGYEPHRTPDGKVIGTRLFHVGRDTPWGMVLRTHFFMGQDLADMVGMPPAQIEGIFPDALGPNTLQHAYDEFSFLSRLLPGIWTAEGCAPESITRPW
jgi:hypothetical protein